MISEYTANMIAQRWVSIWNNGTIEEYLSQYRDDVVLVSSMALRLFPESKGRLTDKKVLYNYWSIIRDKFPDYKFKVSGVSTYENKVIIYYATLNDTTKAICILTMDEEGMIYKIEVSYV